MYQPEITNLNVGLGFRVSVVDKENPARMVTADRKLIRTEAGDSQVVGNLQLAGFECDSLSCQLRGEADRVGSGMQIGQSNRLIQGKVARREVPVVLILRDIDHQRTNLDSAGGDSALAAVDSDLSILSIDREYEAARRGFELER